MWNVSKIDFTKVTRDGWCQHLLDKYRDQSRQVLAKESYWIEIVNMRLIQKHWLCWGRGCILSGMHTDRTLTEGVEAMVTHSRSHFSIKYGRATMITKTPDREIAWHYCCAIRRCWDADKYPTWHCHRVIRRCVIQTLTSQLALPMCNKTLLLFLFAVVTVFPARSRL